MNSLESIYFVLLKIRNIEKIKNDLTLHDDYLKEINENLEKLDQELNSF